MGLSQHPGSAREISKAKLDGRREGASAEPDEWPKFRETFPIDTHKEAMQCAHNTKRVQHDVL